MKTNKLIIILLVVIIAILLIPYLALGAVIGSHASQGAYRSQNGQPARRTVTADDVAGMIYGNLQMKFGENCSAELDTDKGIFAVSIWDENIDTGLVERTAAAEDQSSWESMVYSFTQTANTMQHSFTENRIDGITVVLTVCDPVDHDIPLFIIADGVAGYDAVKGIDLRK